MFLLTNLHPFILRNPFRIVLQVLIMNTQLHLNLIKLTKIFQLITLKKKIYIKPIKVKHGSVHSICYIINKKLAYISDVSKIYNKDFKFFKNLNYLVLDCLWYKNHPSHFNLEKSLALIKTFTPKKAILTNLHSDLDYDELYKKLPKNTIPAYDGLSLNL